MRILQFLTLITLLPVMVLAEPFDVAPGKVLHLDLTGDRWEASVNPPEFLIEERVAGLSNNMLARMKKAGITDKRSAAMKMLGSNELFVFNKASGAHLEVDFSAIKADESIPSRTTIRSSADFAGQALSGEESYRDVNYQVKEISIHGLKYAYRLDASYLRNEKPGRFLGIIGYTEPYWVFFYYTDSMVDSDDFTQMENLIQSLVIENL